jgi:outer membrane receptor protein involved in Fe transport
MTKFLLLILVIIYTEAFAQKTTISATVVNGASKLPVEGINVTLLPLQKSAVTNESGFFSFKEKITDVTSIEITGVGFAKKTLPISGYKEGATIAISETSVALKEVLVTASAASQYKEISKVDIKMRGVNNSQEVLRIVPGLFIGQHQGGGKAEQIFLRGFDCDHGTDISLNLDGIPINLVSHAHGQGYADAHFIIPETIEHADFKKGPYYAEKGNFNTSGFVDFKTADALSKNTIKLEGGMYNTARVLGMFNLLGEQQKLKQQSWYVASEFNYTDSYFDNPQHFKRFNIFSKYSAKISNSSFLQVSASTLQSGWDASGQIPDRAVKEGIIGFYGAIDNTEGGVTSRSNLNVQLLTTLKNNDLIKNQFYYSNYNFDLHTNFTFFLVDTVNGDQIRQKEARNLFGYNGSYHHTGYAGNTRLTTDAGIGFRYDKTNNSQLSNTIRRTIVINPLKLGDIGELNAFAYLSETFRLNEKWSVNAGLRFDQFFNQYNNKLASDSTLNGVGIYKANANIVSPKLSVYYHVNNRTQFYLSTGKGFHSNDTRAVVVTNGREILPPAYGADLGTIIKPADNLLLHAAAWYLWLNQEFVYSGDGGIVELSGKTKRVGFDFSARYEPVTSLYVDVDVNYAHGRSVEDPKGQNYIPLAPVWSTTGGITYVNKNGFNGSLRYRYLANRPAIEDNSIKAKGYFVTDAVLSYTKAKYEIGLRINNIFNTKWKETQFATETRLKNEAEPVTEICFTPGTKFLAVLSIAYFFK